MGAFRMKVRASMAGGAGHDGWTVAGIAALAFVVADLSHEGLGHGLAAQLAGARQIVLSYTYLGSDVQTRWLAAAGPLSNAVEGVVALGLLARFRVGARAAYFLFLLAMFNLLNAAAYLVYSGVLNSGDLAVVVAGLPHRTAVRLGMDVVGSAFYAGGTVVGGRVLGRFLKPRERLTGVGYGVALALNCLAALVNPLGMKYFLISALPATAGANAGMLAMPWRAAESRGHLAELKVQRSWGWIVAGAVAAAVFVGVIGPGLRLKG